jgi:hypothetical protein
MIQGHVGLAIHAPDWAWHANGLGSNFLCTIKLFFLGKAFFCSLAKSISTKEVPNNRGVNKQLQTDKNEKDTPSIYKLLSPLTLI